MGGNDGRGIKAGGTHGGKWQKQCARGAAGGADAVPGEQGNRMSAESTACQAATKQNCGASPGGGDLPREHPDTPWDHAATPAGVVAQWDIPWLPGSVSLPQVGARCWRNESSLGLVVEIPQAAMLC